jgi:uncharacterized protein YuzE
VLLKMPLSYSDHALARMVDRAIYKKQVRRTLRRPDALYSKGPNHLAEYVTSKGVGASQSAPIKTMINHALDVAYVGLLSGRIAETIEVSSGVFYDLDSYGEILGVEILDYSRYQDTEGKSVSIFERLPTPHH